MLEIDEILKFIEADSVSDKKKNAIVGQKYYEGEHDINNYKLYYFNSDGKMIEDKTRSNIKISHPFFTELVDQTVQYMLSGKDEFVMSDNTELQPYLDEYFNTNEDFKAELYEIITGAVTKGFDFMYAYKKEEGKTGFQYADCLCVIEVTAKEASDNKDHIIYWYDDTTKEGNEKIKRIQVWDKDQTYFYVKNKDGKLVYDADEKVNPRPHIVKVDDKGDKYDGGSYGVIPFFRLDNCRKQHSDLKPIKGLIDDYDLMACGLSNNIQDANEYLVVIKGYPDDNMDEVIKNLKTKKVIGVDGDGASDGVDFKTVDIPYEARKIKLELDEKNIYRFGMGFNSAQIGDGNITNIVIKSRYALLDMKCNKLEIHLKQFLSKILKLVIAEINEMNGTDFKTKDVYFNFEREVMTNAHDNAAIEKTDAETQQIKINTLLNVAAQIGGELLIQNICEVLDIDYESVKSELPKEEEYDMNAAQSILNTVQVGKVGGAVE